MNRNRTACTPAQAARVANVGAALLLAASVATAQTSQPTAAELAAQIREQQRAIDAQKAELERQQKQLEALAAALEAQQKAAAAQPTVTPPTSAAALASSANDARVSDSRGLRWSGYADMSYQRYDFFANAQTREPVNRGRADITRFVLAPHYHFGRGWSFFGELEIEHGGTGATIEYESEEAGEYEMEVEKGGEVVLEQLYLQYSHSPALNVRMGELVVPFGMINSYHQPTEYFTIERSLAEASIIPTVWHESGVQLLGTLGQARYQLQLVTALDSTGFSGYEFVRGGMQGKMEFKNASAFALVAQGEYAFGPGIVIGGAFYSGDSAPNRPRINLQQKANVTLFELHGRYEVGPWTLRGQHMVGRISNADAITQANLGTYNGSELGTSRTPIGSKAVGSFIEAGYNLLPLLGRREGDRLDVFARYDRYDTHAATTGNISRIARYEREAATVGLNYKPQPGLVLKAEYSRRQHAGTLGNKQDTYGLAGGFEF